ncbi:hypothetical protein CIG75_20410 [Tumebacillus algifaecis]|uniref:Methylamine utilisation protein MauE domain-containing protein n=1 Tax=Tumebacillus algifaecis TaxID=1214604 RepID=A0A223D638_9BACL|nr:MauE/DoxX family redox-associated membrane protein [Tumebacillus algifaecis]ASS77031.1 hypothetical protein CIG75_20410 [Tumebacillus algifaecis]
MSKWKILQWLVRCVFAALFLYSGIWKAFTWTDTQAIIKSYELLPDTDWIIGTVAILIIIVEIVASVLMIWPRKQNWGVALSAVLLIVFTAILTYKYGDWLEYGCGCVGDDTGHAVGMKDIMKNVLLLSMLGLMMWMRKEGRDQF